MKNLRLLSCLICLSVFASACEDDSNSANPHFAGPWRLLIAPKDVTFQGRTSRFGYVSNPASGTITLFEPRRLNVIDTDDFDSDETPLTVGGAPSQLFAWRPSGLDSDIYYKLVVVEPKQQRLFLYDVQKDSVDGEASVEHKAVNAGDLVVVAGTPIFFDRGRSSNPALLDLELDSDKTKSENWRVQSDGELRWRVEGSVSGEQERQAISGERYVSDNGQIRFTIHEGERQATDEDIFYFGTARLRPFELTSVPAAALLVEDTLYLANRDLGQLEVLDLNTLTYAAPITLDDGSGEAVLATDIASNGETLIVTNRGAGNSIFLVDILSQTATPLTLGFKTRRAFVKRDAATVFLLPEKNLEVATLDLVDQTLGEVITLTNIPTAMDFLDGDEGVDGDALVVNQNNVVDLVDLGDLERVDTRPGNNPESASGGVLFFDTGEESNPTLVEIITQDGVTRTESWVLNFEGVIANSPSTTGLATGNVITDPAVTFSDLTIAEGDHIIFYPDSTSQREELTIQEITATNELILSSAPDAQGADLPYEIRSNNSYTMMGSLSGFQSRRLREGVSGRSDNEEILLSINPASPSTATTRGDYFTFDTQDGVTPIAIDGDFGVDIQVFEKRAFVVNQNSENLSIISIPALENEARLD